MATRRNKINGNELLKRFIGKRRRRSNERKIQPKKKTQRERAEEEEEEKERETGRKTKNEREREKARKVRKARKSSLKLTARANSDAIERDRVFTSGRGWRRYGGWRSGIYPR